MQEIKSQILQNPKFKSLHLQKFIFTFTALRTFISMTPFFCKTDVTVLNSVETDDYVIFEWNTWVCCLLFSPPGHPPTLRWKDDYNFNFQTFQLILIDRWTEGSCCVVIHATSKTICLKSRFGWLMCNLSAWGNQNHLSIKKKSDSHIDACTRPIISKN